MGKSSLSKARKNKNDEFYTQMKDIEKELKFYRRQLEGKVVFCNCDNPKYSNFWKYFKREFSRLKLKGLVATYYDEDNPSYKYSYDGISVIKERLKGDGDFRSKEVVDILEKVDVVVSNPPFSLFRVYVAQLIEYEKKFLVIGNMNAITYKEIFPLLKNNQMWLGNSPRGMKFKTPEGEFKAISNTFWYTNLEINKRNEDLLLYKKYKPEKYPKYDNYDAINTDVTKNIPDNYYGVIGVPISFIHKYSPEQFNIIGVGNSRANFQPNKVYENIKRVDKAGKSAPNASLNSCLVLNVKDKPINKTHYIDDNNRYLIAPYARLLIQRKRKIEDTRQVA